MPEIIVGRDKEDLKKYGNNGTILLGRNIVGKGFDTHLATEIQLDVIRPHVILISGKRGTGKSYTSISIAEEISKLPAKIKKNLCVIAIDTQGIFWSMKYPNLKQRELLEKWGLEPKKFEVEVYIPEGLKERFEKEGIPYDKVYTISVEDISFEEWCFSLQINPNDLEGILLSKVMESLGKVKNLDILIKEIEKAEFEEKTKLVLKNKIESAKRWGIFGEKGIDANEILKPGKICIFDVSFFTSISETWNVRNLIVALLLKKIFDARVKARRLEEMKEIEYEYAGRILPLPWIIIDEAHNFIPAKGSTASTPILLKIVKEGRQPGISNIFITQMPNKLHREVLAQTDLLIAHRLTAFADIQALKEIMHTYMMESIDKLIDELPKEKGSAILIDDNSERVYKVQIKPRQSWHSGESASAI